ncbi:PTS sugar transporter subunit IIA [Enorma phocaeensis]|uniref:PTS sugar transporter subunit IIA n=1 Tax=Enorma phocaeensis TaxID=1871019 RepID=UPI000C82D58C|nr:PTS sugar transporter subunit IIA [Enorma phocaeensis]
MELRDVLTPQMVHTGVDVADKDGAIRYLARVLVDAGYVDDLEAFVADVYLRETEGITGIGGGIAIPHGKSASVTVPAVAVATLAHPIAWETLDGGDVDAVFLFCAGDSNEGAREHLVLLSKVATKLADDDLVVQVRHAQSPEEIVRLMCG